MDYLSKILTYSIIISGILFVEFPTPFIITDNAGMRDVFSVYHHHNNIFWLCIKHFSFFLFIFIVSTVQPIN
eukprot:gene4374-3180_t